MDLVKSGAADADTKIDGALRSGTTAKWSKYTMLCLHYCREDQSHVARTVPECRALVREYKI
ncbi:unnamed protein product [Miscanthus lutarioriparius]|uniref:Uncharacterized protein n=1 Tax=Miscanthus lutarioriparius TaxID=422564 RepID=A0A811QCL5_9POAL|nr:unnamed protein product [Miscanthus lutarioriparius]CAD6341834.1 unnamed protein product [Miscanthus lutarioriparius]